MSISLNFSEADFEKFNDIFFNNIGKILTLDGTSFCTRIAKITKNVQNYVPK